MGQFDEIAIGPARPTPWRPVAIREAVAVDFAALRTFEAHALRIPRIHEALENGDAALVSNRRELLEFVERDLFHKWQTSIKFLLDVSLAGYELDPQSQAAVSVYPKEHARLGATVELEQAVIVRICSLSLARYRPQLAAENARLALEFRKAAMNARRQ
jgi:hypothetical protein